MEIAVLGIDLGKNSCSVGGLDGTSCGTAGIRYGDVAGIRQNDDWDAEAIAAAATRPAMRFVELKSAEQFNLQSLNRSAAG